ncbi:hypothetical protein ANCDUO_26633 [Ancylostoma duodenale]|uniref:Uncharacterized protein n=1 Tax=Ancylostoma duodenale TaxID=51022 RepID=A0A0C2BI02_9BILA|nr:hypothetical protein ANCDUO_26633 [Ancylostoma duodenale]
MEHFMHKPLALVRNIDDGAGQLNHTSPWSIVYLFGLTDRFFLKKVRWQISILAHIGFAISFAIRSNFGVAKNRMISNFTDAWGDHHVSYCILTLLCLPCKQTGYVTI